MSYNKKEIEALASLEKTIELTDETSPAYASLISARDDLKSKLSNVTITPPTPPNPYNSQGEKTYRVEEEQTAGWAVVDNGSNLTKAEAQEVVQRLYDNGYAPNRVRILVDGQR